MSTPHEFDVVVIGSGPAGQKSAVQAAKSGKRVLILEKELGVGGACVHRGTIPSKSLRETAVYFLGLRARCGPGGSHDLSHPTCAHPRRSRPDISGPPR